MSRRLVVFVVALAALTVASLAPLAFASHLSGSIDCASSNLTDLNATIQSNFHTNFLGGFRQDSVFSDTPGSLADFCSRMQTRSNRTGNPGDPDYCYYPNAYDMVHAYALFDPYDDEANTVYSGHTDFYAGWDVTAFIGDVDADGNPNASTLQRCGTNLLDEPGIGPWDDYFIDFFNCTRTARIFSIHITNNHAEIRNATNAVVSPAGVTVTYSLPADGSGNIASSNTMKLCVTNLEAILAAVGASSDINGTIAVMHNICGADFLSGDFSCDMQLQLQPRIAVHSSMPSSAFVGDTVDCAITISNAGMVALNAVTAQTVLGSGLTYSSENVPPGFPTSTGDGATRSWNASSANLPPADSLVIHVFAIAMQSSQDLCATVDVTGNNTCNLSAPPASAHADPCVVVTATDLALPSLLSFGAPRPNPAGTAVTLTFGLPASTRVSALVFDVTGRAVRRLESAILPPGWHELTWDLRDGSGRRVDAGLYFVRLATGHEMRTRNVAVLK